MFIFFDHQNSSVGLIIKMVQRKENQKGKIPIFVKKLTQILNVQLLFNAGLKTPGHDFLVT